MRHGGGQQRQGRRTPETQLLVTEALEFIQERYGDLIERIQNINALRAPASSVNSTSHPAHNIFFDSFKAFGMIICERIPENNEAPNFSSQTFDAETKEVPLFPEMNSSVQIFDNKILIPTNDWTLAFIEEDLKLITETLWQGIYYCFYNPFVFRAQDIRDYGIYIERVALWMADKRKDPFSFNYITQIFQTPTPQQRLELDIGRDNFLRRLGNENIVQLVGDDLFNRIFALPDPGADPGNLNDVLNDLEQNAAIPENEMKVKYAQIFKEFVAIIQQKNGAWGLNPARIATALTRAVIPLNTDIRVDCVPFSNNRWTAAAGRNLGLAELAEKLYNTHFVNDFIEPGINYGGLHSICPFKRLAIYRGSMFLWKVWHGEIRGARTCDFNPEIDSHNEWPNPEEREQIEIGLANTVEKKSREYGIQPEIIQNPEIDMMIVAAIASDIMEEQPQVQIIPAVNNLMQDNFIQPQAEILQEQQPQGAVGINAVNWDELVSMVT